MQLQSLTSPFDKLPGPERKGSFSFHHFFKGLILNFGSAIIGKKGTLPETNIAPTNGWLEYYFPIGEAYFQGLR